MISASTQSILENKGHNDSKLLKNSSEELDLNKSPVSVDGSGKMESHVVARSSPKNRSSLAQHYSNAENLQSSLVDSIVGIDEDIPEIILDGSRRIEENKNESLMTSETHLLFASQGLNSSNYEAGQFAAIENILLRGGNARQNKNEAGEFPSMEEILSGLAGVEEFDSQESKAYYPLFLMVNQLISSAFFVYRYRRAISNISSVGFLVSQYYKRPIDEFMRKKMFLHLMTN